MKCKVERKEVSGFKPVKVKITLQSEEELNEFYVIFNHRSIANSTPNLNHDLIRDQLDKVLKPYYGNVNYTEAFDKLNTAIKSCN